MISNHNEACKILGISVNANADEWKVAYRNILKQYHPDNNGGRLDEGYYLAKEAYDFLEKEKAYCSQKYSTYSFSTSVPGRNKIIGGNNKYQYNHSDYQKLQRKYNDTLEKKKQEQRAELKRKSEQIRMQDTKLKEEEILEKIGWIRIAQIIHETIENDKKNNKNDFNNMK